MIAEDGLIERRRRNGDGRHGTPAGASRHAWLGEDPCDACRAAKAEYDKRRLEATPLQIRNRLHAKAQQLATGEIRRAHPDEYRAAYLRHKAALLAELDSS